jgi:pyruvate ferredoxin oxidoreductase alpha subunit
VIVNLDGFYLSFTREPVEMPDSAMAKDFVGSFNPENIRFRASSPESQAVAVLGGGPYSYFRYESHLAAVNALAVHDELAQEFNARFGRQYAAIDTYRTEDAEYLFVMMGSFSTKARAAVDLLRNEGWSIGLLRPRLLRPLPVAQFQRLLSGRKAVAVIDQNISMGMGGVLHSEVTSAVYGHHQAPPVIASFIGGLGGRDISNEEFYKIAKTIRKAADRGVTPPPRLLYTQAELREVKKLQAIAQVERDELGDDDG